ncbi:MAG: fibronectin type III domain-containing protein [Legionella sp.]|nr:fibronectin type III domain-containing protein [Legionella sp.]
MRRIASVCAVFFFHATLANANVGRLFEISETGNVASADILLCLNGKAALSCQNYHISAENMSIRATAAHTYPAAGIKVLTPGYSPSGCLPYGNGYCLFNVSNTAGASLQLNASGSANKQNQSLQFTAQPPATADYNTSFTVSADASSGLPVTFTSSGVCTNSGSTYQMNAGTGTCEVIVNQAGDANYNPATALIQTVTAAQVAQASLTLNAPSSIVFNTSSNLTTTGGSGTGTVSYTLTSGSAYCSLNGATITGTAVGSCSVKAIKASDGNYLATESSDVSITVSPAVPGSPTAVTAAIGNGASLVSWTAPTNDGGRIDTYTVTASSGGFTCSATPPTTQCTVSGLTNGNSYTFTGTATNTAGTSPSSAASNSVIPTSLQVLGNFSNATGYFSPTTPPVPWGSLIEDVNHNLYGVAPNGGSAGLGTVFKFSTATNTFTVLADFTQLSTGALPYASLVMGSDGNLYGTTAGGGTHSAGTIFKIAVPNGPLTILASFDPSTNPASGSAPYGKLLELSPGEFYGTTQSGGTNSTGTIFKFSTNGNTITTLAAFDVADGGGRNVSGSAPFAGLIEVSGDLYGTASAGGQYSYGTVYKFSPSSNTITPLASFDFIPTDGASPYASLLAASNGFLYGTTTDGANGGTVFVISLSGTMNTVAYFDDANGKVSYAPLMQNGNYLYGTTSAGGTNSGGTLFKVSLSDSTLSVVNPLNASDPGNLPYAGLLLSTNGNIYGTTTNGGGMSNQGTIFVLYPPFS